MKASRHMPKREAPSKPTWRAILFVMALAALGLYVMLEMIWTTPLTAIGFALAAIALATASIHMARKLKRLRLSRQDDSICTFVRELPIREIDTWIVRATYEELCDYLGTKEEPFPIRPSDRLSEDLGIADDEDLGMVVCSIADRCGRSLEDLEKNPLWPKPKTVQDVISMLMHQKKLKTAEHATGG